MESKKFIVLLLVSSLLISMTECQVFSGSPSSMSFSSMSSDSPSGSPSSSPSSSSVTSTMEEGAAAATSVYEKLKNKITS
ncbi:unnamed protein product [Cuscuta epithymum]|uniref:Uncharacterized protein n=1 Tax=Cuscuta epithymum TaxID=186058 RepID=A0AAV0G1U1_9ASTE|nr:unnamed protein product [Cuscuta epithymum]